ncbi:DEKNAAC102019 [Brettanomyces naardenensis]|uniref:DEKNAAC102019 n=1 Tax=Brettanomyces naardenensis TaxID=13370 RepID=A0A448YJC2_BRENA|nr:DEKNAAC102019 [Brettanomyces naardenensis]
MLKTARSLPSLRLLAQQQVSSVSASAKQFSSATFRPTPSRLEGGFKFNKFIHRAVHSTSKKETILLDLNNDSRAKYASMNCQGLKMELKRRGLRVSGKKLDLIQRLCQADSSQLTKSSSTSTRSFSTTMETPTERAKKSKRRTKKVQKRELSTQKHETVAKPSETKKVACRAVSTSTAVKAKDDSSRIDYFKPAKKEGEPIEHIKIPSLKTQTAKEVPKEEPKKEPKKEPRKEEKQEPSKDAKDAKQEPKSEDPVAKKTTSDAFFWSIAGFLTIIWWAGRKRDGRRT